MASVSPRKNLKKYWLLAVLIAGAVFISWRIWSLQGQPQERGGRGMDKTIPVATAKAVQGELKLFLSGLGTVTPANSVLVKSRVDGQLLRLHFKEGQTVKEGDLLAEIDPRPFQVQLAQAEGQLARDTALLKNAQIDLERYKTLWSQDSIAKQQVDAQEALVRQYEGTVKVDEGQVADAKLQLSYAKVTAPASGRVGLRQVDPGNIVHASDATGIVLITQVQPMHVIFTLPEDNLPRLVQKLNARQTIAIDAFDRQQKFKLASGTLLTIDNQIDTTTGTVKLKAEFKNDDNALFPNQFVNVSMQIDTLSGVTLVPVSAVQRGAQDNFVYILQPDNTVKLQSVRVGDTESDRVVIVDGIKPGDEVIVEGLDRLRDGIAVEPVKRDGQMLDMQSGETKQSGGKKQRAGQAGNEGSADEKKRARRAE